MQPGDVPVTSADVSALTAWADFKPGMPIVDGVVVFVDWYRKYFAI
jgi:UDP-glucuronate 4-epimerase